MPKAEAMIAKWRRARRKISLFSKKEEESNNGNKKDLDQIKHKYLL